MPRFPPIKSFENLKDSEGTKLCRNCDNQVAKGRRNYCSKNCMLEFFNNHHWPTIRQTVLRRDKFTCGICNKRTNKKLLDIDHIIPINLGGDKFNKDNLRALCKECHKAKTKLDRDALKD